MLLRTPERLGPSPNNPTSPVYPLAANFANGVNLFHPDYQAPAARSCSIGLQRAINRLTAIEVRYVGTRLVDGSTTENWNEINFTSNGFLDEFRRAQQNLQSHIAAGCGQAGGPACSFAYRGAGRIPSDLPRGVQWTRRERRRRSRAVRRSELDQRTAPGGTRDAESQSRWRGLDTLHDRRVPHQYDHRRIPEELLRPQSRRRGSQFEPTGASRSATRSRCCCGARCRVGSPLTSTTPTHDASTATLDTLRQSRELVSSRPMASRMRAKLTTTYELPFGRGKRYQSDANRWLDGIIGGWALNLAGRVQSGSILNFGNVRVVGMSLDELRDSYKVRFDDATGNIFMLPQDIIDNTIKAYSTSATTASGYGALGPPTGRYLAPANGADCIQETRGDCAPHDVYVEGPIFTRFDLNAKKRFDLRGRRNIEFGVDIFNLFNAINFLAVAQASMQPHDLPGDEFAPGPERHIRSWRPAAAVRVSSISNAETANGKW